MPQARLWTTKELQILKSGLSVQEIAAQTGRSIGAVYAQRHKMGLNDGVSRKRFTAEQKNRILTAEYGKDRELAKELGVSYASIRNIRARERRLSEPLDVVCPHCGLKGKVYRLKNSDTYLGKCLNCLCYVTEKQYHRQKMFESIIEGLKHCDACCDCMSDCLGVDARHKAIDILERILKNE